MRPQYRIVFTLGDILWAAAGWACVAIVCAAIVAAFIVAIPSIPL